MKSRDVAHFYHLHQLRWDWTYRNIREFIGSWPGRYYIKPIRNCYGCYFDKLFPFRGCCAHCLLDFEPVCLDPNSLYEQWRDVTSIEEAKCLALKIRDTDLSDFAKKILLQD